MTLSGRYQRRTIILLLWMSCLCFLLQFPSDSFTLIRWNPWHRHRGSICYSPDGGKAKRRSLISGEHNMIYDKPTMNVNSSERGRRSCTELRMNCRDEQQSPTAPQGLRATVREASYTFPKSHPQTQTHESIYTPLLSSLTQNSNWSFQQSVASSLHELGPVLQTTASKLHKHPKDWWLSDSKVFKLCRWWQPITLRCLTQLSDRNMTVERL